MENVVIEVAMEEQIQEVSTFWGIDEIKSITKEYKFIKNASEKNVWSINERYMLKVTSEENEMRINVIMACLLAREQIPAQKLIPLKNGELYLYHKGYYYGLFTKIKGELVKDYLDKDYLDRAYYVGNNIGWLHYGLNNITDELSYSKVLVNSKVVSDIEDYIKPLLKSLSEEKLLTSEKCESVLSVIKEIEDKRYGYYNDLTKHLIHKNLSNQSLLFYENKLSGYIDFELVEVNLRIVDICKFSLSILESVFYIDKGNEKWIDFHNELLKGYNNWAKLTEKENECIKYIFYEVLVYKIEKSFKNGNIKQGIKAIDIVEFLYSYEYKNVLNAI